MLAKQKYTATPPAKAIDFCTRSGCIALALKKLFPTAEVWATDVSEKALKTARHNAKDIFGTNDTIRFLKHDLLQENTLPENPKFDLIVSNPPYIAREEATAMNPSVLDFEPHLALFPENNDPIVFYKKLLAMAQSYLNPDGILLCEINLRYASELVQLGKNAGFTSSVLHDLSGKERFWEGGFADSEKRI